MNYNYIIKVLNFMDIEWRYSDYCRLILPLWNLFIRYCPNEDYYVVYKVGYYEVVKNQNQVIDKIMEVISNEK